MSNSASIVFITQDSLQSKILAGIISKQFPLQHIIVQKSHSPKPPKLPIRILQKILGKGGLEVLLILTKDKKQRETLLMEKKLMRKSDDFLSTKLSSYGISEWPNTKITFTEDINSKETEEKIRLADPALIIVWASGILKPNIIALPLRGLTNAHPSILPKYKGSFPEFWECLFDDLSHTGITFHFINEKVDDGPIIEQIPYKGSWPIDPYSLKAINVLSILESYPKVIESVLSDSYQPKTQEKTNDKTLRYKDITWEKKRALFEKLKLL